MSRNNGRTTTNSEASRIAAPSIVSGRRGAAATSLRSAVAAEQLTQSRPLLTVARLAAISFPVAIAFIAINVTGHSIAWAAAFIAVTVLLVSLQFAVHEAIHGSLFRSQRLNELAGTLFGALTLIHFAPYRSYHLEHHRRTHEESDPEPIVVLRSRTHYVAALVGAMPVFVCSLTWNLARSVVGRPAQHAQLTRRAYLDVASAAATMLTLGAAAWSFAAGDGVAVLTLWFVPALTALVAGGVFVLPEHYGCAYGPDTPLRTSRTTTTNAATRFIMWNGNFHTAHHMVPSVTAPNLKRLNTLLDEVDHVSPSYASFHHAIWRDLGRGDLVDPPPWDHEEFTIDLR